jgi:peroxiredoxin
MPISSLPLGANAPDFSLPGVDGKTYSLKSFAGSKAIVVIFSCNHCPYVVAYEDRLIALAREFQPQGVAFIAINANDAARYPDDSFENMKLRAQQKDFPFPYVSDETQDVAEAFGAAHTPEIYVLDGDRKLAYHGRIDDNYQNPSKVTRRELHDALTALVAGKPVPEPETFAIGCTIKWKPGRG